MNTAYADQQSAETQPQKPRSEVVTFATNIPQDLALRWNDGKAIHTNHGDRVMFTTTDERKLFVDPWIADQIRSLGIAARETFRIGKYEVRKGEKKELEWRVQRLSAQPKNSEVLRTMREQQSTAPPAPEPAPAMTVAPPLGSSNLMAAAVMQAIDAVAAGEAHAKSLGMTFKFTEQHISSLACTVYIQHSKLLGGNTQWQQ